MKIARVQLADGRVARFSVPDDATPGQVTAAATRLSQAKPKAAGGFLGGLKNVVSSGNELLLGGLEGIYNAASAITDPIAEGAMNLISGGDAGTRARQGANRQRRNVVSAAERTFIPQPNPLARTVGRVGGAMALPVPKIAGAGRLANIANRAIQGAVGGAGVREVDESATAPAAIGAATNVVLPPLISRAVQSRPVQAVARSLMPQGVPPLATAPLAPLGRKAQARAARFDALGVKPTTGMVTRDPAAFSFEQNTAKVAGGEDLARQMRSVESGLVDKSRTLVRDMGGAKGPEATGKAVEDALDAKRAEMQQVTSRLYDDIRETRGDELVGRLNNLREKMTDPDVVDNAAFDAMREGLVRRMTRLGVIGKGGSLSQPVTVRQAEELRKFIGGLGNNMEPGVRMMRGRLIDALDDDVVSAVGDDAFKAARASAKARFEEFSKTFAGKLADEKLAPELLTKRVLGDGVKLSDLRALRRSLSTGTPDQIARGQEAWGGLRSQAVEDLLNKSVDADGNLIGSTLSREFGKSAAKFRELLGPQDFKMLRRLAAATRDVKSFPVGHSVNTSNTAATLASMFDNAPPKVRQGWLKLLAKSGGMHAAAFLSAGPAGNFALGTGQALLQAEAQARAANVLIRRIQMAQNPEAAAAAIQEAQKAAASSPTVADFLNRAGIGRMIGGLASSSQ